MKRIIFRTLLLLLTTLSSFEFVYSQALNLDDNQSYSKQNTFNYYKVDIGGLGNLTSTLATKKTLTQEVEVIIGNGPNAKKITVTSPLENGMVYTLSPDKKFIVGYEYKGFYHPNNPMKICKIDILTQETVVVHTTATPFIVDGNLHGYQYLNFSQFKSNDEVVLSLKSTSPSIEELIFYKVNFRTNQVEISGTSDIQKLENISSKLIYHGDKNVSKYFLVKNEYHLIANTAGEVSIYNFMQSKLERYIDFKVPESALMEHFQTPTVDFNDKTVTFSLKAKSWSFEAVYDLVNNKIIKRNYLSPSVYPLSELKFKSGSLWALKNDLDLIEVELPSYPDGVGYNHSYKAFDKSSYEYFPDDKKGLAIWKNEFYRIDSLRKQLVSRYLNNENILLKYHFYLSSNFSPPSLISIDRKYWNEDKSAKKLHGKDGLDWLNNTYNALKEDFEEITIRNNRIINSKAIPTIKVYGIRDSNSKLLFEFKKVKNIISDSSSSDKLIVEYLNGTIENYDFVSHKLSSTTVESDF